MRGIGILENLNLAHLKCCFTCTQCNVSITSFKTFNSYKQDVLQKCEIAVVSLFSLFYSAPGPVLCATRRTNFKSHFLKHNLDIYLAFPLIHLFSDQFW